MDQKYSMYIQYKNNKIIYIEIKKEIFWVAKMRIKLNLSHSKNPLNSLWLCNFISATLTTL